MIILLKSFGIDTLNETWILHNMTIETIEMPIVIPYDISHLEHHID